jgi:uncharacterized membrane protein YqgA involved in biofilm formation
VAVLAGGSPGLFVGVRWPEGMRKTALQAIWLIALLIGVSYFSRPLTCSCRSSAGSWAS